jgi:hypothetical protein
LASCSSSFRCCLLLASLAAGGRAYAATIGDPPPPEAVDQASVAQPSGGPSVADGAYLPLTLSPTVGAVPALVTGQGGYDTARRSAISQTFVEVQLWGPLALRGGAELGDTTTRLRPTIGARLQLLTQQRHAIDGSVSVFYRAEGFTEPEGEIETVIALGRRLGRAVVIANLAYGQDPEGRERDGELRAALLAQVSRLVHLGVDGRGRFDLGSDRAKLRASNEPTFDLDAGPVATLTLGPVALTGHAGVSVIRRVESDATVGLIALAGLGTAFR